MNNRWSLNSDPMEPQSNRLQRIRNPWISTRKRITWDSEVVF